MDNTHNVTSVSKIDFYGKTVATIIIYLFGTLGYSIAINTDLIHFFDKMVPIGESRFISAIIGTVIFALFGAITFKYTSEYPFFASVLMISLCTAIYIL